LTIALTTHYFPEAEDADQVCIISRGRAVMRGNPGQLRKQVPGRHVLLDAGDRETLGRELRALGAAPSGDGPFSVGFAGHTPQQLLAAITTPLSLLRVCEPTLDDLYAGLIVPASAEPAGSGVAAA
jgi:ABC-2 type transport system ATP-binding protein